MTCLKAKRQRLLDSVELARENRGHGECPGGTGASAAA
jgi:hypothetical protein